MKMSDAAINQYMSKLLKSNGKDLTDLEQEAFEQFVSVDAEIGKAEANLKNIENEVRRIQTSMLQAQGKRNAYADILIRAENNRRSNNELTINLENVQKSSQVTTGGNGKDETIFRASQ